MISVLFVEILLLVILIVVIAVINNVCCYYFYWVTETQTFSICTAGF